jgi:P4 family phage/plasmid primase-like protien
MVTNFGNAAKLDSQPPDNSLPNNSVESGTSLVRLYGPPYFEKNGALSSLNQAFWAGQFMTENTVLFEPREGTFYLYEDTSGLYRATTDAVILIKVADRILQYSREATTPQLARFRSEKSLRGIIAYLKGLSEKSDPFQGERKFIHLANGVIDLGDTTSGLRQFSPHYRSRNASPIHFSSNTKCPRFINELLAPLEDSDKELLQKMFGQILLGRNLTQRFLVLDGEADAGKSQLARVIQNIVGTVNCAELRTKLLEERFEIASFVNKTLLSGVDVAADFLSTPAARVIKGLVGGDLMEAEHKNRNARFQLHGNLNCLITSNSKLRVRLQGDDGAWRRRILIIRYAKPRQGQKIPEFYKVLLHEEGPGILNWALDGLRKLMIDIKDQGDIKLSQKHRDIINSLMAESDSLRLFAKSEIEQTSAGQCDLTTDEIIHSYFLYCNQRGWDMIPSSTAQKMLPNIMTDLFGVLKSHDIKRQGKNVRGFAGVRFRTDHEID